MNLSGEWEGYYEYGIGYYLPYFGERVKLYISLEDLNEGLTGKCSEEESEFSVPSIASIKGFHEEEYISFVKTYPIRPQISQDQKSIEMLEGELEIEHEGYVDRNNQAMYGIWRISDFIVDPNSGERIQNIVEGTWLLKKSHGMF